MKQTYYMNKKIQGTTTVVHLDEFDSGMLQYWFKNFTGKFCQEKEFCSPSSPSRCLRKQFETE